MGLGAWTADGTRAVLQSFRMRCLGISKEFAPKALGYWDIQKKLGFHWDLINIFGFPKILLEKHGDIGIYKEKMGFH